MELVVSGRVRLRAAVVWLAATVGLLGLTAAFGPFAAAVLRGPGPTFADALVQACAAAALVAGTALWLAATDVAWSLLRSRILPDRSIGPVRRWLLTACGLTVLATAGPAHADPPAGSDPAGSGAPAGAEVLDGLPLPDRPVGDVTARRAAVVTVRPGDSLWTIAVERLGPGATRADVAAYWRRLQDLNAAALGPDPDLIRPGQSLRLPPA